MPFNKDTPLELVVSEDGQHESKRANAAFRDYVRMGVARSLRDLLAHYQTVPQPPTASWGTISTWSHKFYWVERSTILDQLQLIKDQEIFEASRRELLTKGLALNYHRLGELEELFEQLKKYTKDEDRVWLPDVKSIGQGPTAERVDIVRFNSALIEQTRGLLDDIAAEVGGRVRKSEVTGKDGKDLVPTPETMPPSEIAARVAALLAQKGKNDGN